MKYLKKQYQELAAEFEAEYGNSYCRCHINPPCDYCTHEGNPACLAGNEDAWETFKTVAVKYATSTQLYTFMTDEECEVGDKAVVFTNGSWSVVTIMEVHDEPQLTGNYQYTWLVQIVDRTNYDRHIQEDHEGTPQVGSRL